MPSQHHKCSIHYMRLAFIELFTSIRQYETENNTEESEQNCRAKNLLFSYASLHTVLSKCKAIRRKCAQLHLNFPLDEAANRLLWLLLIIIYYYQLLLMIEYSSCFFFYFSCARHTAVYIKIEACVLFLWLLFASACNNDHIDLDIPCHLYTYREKCFRSAGGATRVLLFRNCFICIRIWECWVYVWEHWMCTHVENVFIWIFKPN